MFYGSLLTLHFQGLHDVRPVAGWVGWRKVGKSKIVVVGKGARGGGGEYFQGVCVNIYICIFFFYVLLL